MSKFYKEFARYYDDIFYVSDDVTSFLNYEFIGNKVLDVGCASGGYARYFASLNYDVTAFDLSEEMIKNAKKNDIDNKVNFFTANMLEYKKEQYYDNIYCIGSTIAHLPSEDDINNFIRTMYNNLKIGGKAIIQTLNYINIYNNNINQIDSLESRNGNVILERRFHKEGNYLSFDTSIKTKDEEYTNCTKIFPISLELFTEIFSELGINDFKVYNDFTNEPFTSNNMVLVIVINKNII